MKIEGRNLESHEVPTGYAFYWVEQRLKNVMIAPVDQNDLDVGMPQRACCGNSGKPPSTMTIRGFCAFMIRRHSY
ncbi:hypothetical protein [Pseudomonas sp. BIC9C]|uniref:hypothetical protein n=1 Tax=Pseudomonas sp. BIC9C TaxID=3078458 RepID=UPI002AD33B4A|nr:hypothetical protein [Pseudomonas sp. BIC9C]